MTTARSRYQRRFNARSSRSRSQDLAKQARTTVSVSGRSRKERRLLARWERGPNQLDIKGIDTRRRGWRASRMRTRLRPTRATRRMRTPSAQVTPPPAVQMALPAPRRREAKRSRSEIADRMLKARAWREFRKLQPAITPAAYRSAQRVLRGVLSRHGVRTTSESSDDALKRIKGEFHRGMMSKHPDFGPAWGRRGGTL